MIRATDPISSIVKASVEAGGRYASLSLQETESLVKCQIGVARELFTVAGKQLTQWSIGNPASMAGVDWPAYFCDSAERTAELGRACAEAVTKTQSELARLSQEQLGLLGRMWQENLQGITRAAEAAGITGADLFEHKHKKAA